jgi:hypothetical protein
MCLCNGAGHCTRANEAIREIVAHMRPTFSPPWLCPANVLMKSAFQLLSFVSDARSLGNRVPRTTLMRSRILPTGKNVADVAAELRLWASTLAMSVLDASKDAQCFSINAHVWLQPSGAVEASVECVATCPPQFVPDVPKQLAQVPENGEEEEED